jgi:hypothetical protein
MIRFEPPTMGQSSIYDVFKTSPGRINPRTGKLVAYKEYEAIAPWELEEKMRSRGGRGRRDEEEDRFREYPRPRRDYGEMFRSSMAGLSGPGEYFGNAVPWIFLGVAAIVALEAAGITHLSPGK